MTCEVFFTGKTVWGINQIDAAGQERLQHVGIVSFVLMLVQCKIGVEQVYIRRYNNTR